MLVTSCNKNETNNPVVEQGKPATLQISIAGESAKSRAVNPSAVIPEESMVHDYKVFVINANDGVIQSVQTFGSELTVNLTGLTSGEKRIVVVANTANTSLVLPSVGASEYELENPGMMLDIQDQMYDKMVNNGFVMSGGATMSLQPGANEYGGTIKITRIVSKVRLGSVTITPIAGHEGDFELQSVFIMKGIKEASYGANSIHTNPYMIGGMTGSATMYQSEGFIETITNSDNTGRLFYVFPNERADSNSATLLVVEGTYNGETRYFPVRINDNSGIGGSTSDGTYIKRNGQYTLNLTIKRPNDGSLNPETPVDPATMGMTIEVEEWANELTQNIEI